MPCRRARSFQQRDASPRSRAHCPGSRAHGLDGSANRLRKLLPREHPVTIIERQPLVSFPPAYLRVLDGRRQPQAITRDLRRLSRRGIDLIAAEVSGFDTGARSVQTEGGAVPTTSS